VEVFALSLRAEKREHHLRPDWPLDQRAHPIERQARHLLVSGLAISKAHLFLDLGF